MGEWKESGCILKVKLAGPAVGLDAEDVGKREILPKQLLAFWLLQKGE